MATVVTINRPDVVALIAEAAGKLADGNKTEAIAVALRRLLDQQARTGSLFGARSQSRSSAPVQADRRSSCSGSRSAAAGSSCGSAASIAATAAARLVTT